MSAESTTYSSTAYQAFFSIEPGEFKEKIRFIDRYKQALDALTLNEYVEVMDAYAEALFETGRYERHILVADDLIELSIRHNISRVGERDLYFETLFQKAASLYNLHKTDQAIHILRELLKMQPDHESSRLFLINCHVREQAHFLAKIRNISIICIIACAVVIAIELLFLRPHIPQIADVAEIVRNTMFIGGTGLLLIGELWVRYRAVSRMYDFVRAARSRNKQSSEED